MVEDLHLPVRVHGCPIVREDSGLALSSRNRYLNEEEHHTALMLSRALATGSYDEALAVLKNAEGIELDYLAVTTPELEELPEGYTGPARLLVAAKVGQTRLIDNAEIQV